MEPQTKRPRSNFDGRGGQPQGGGATCRHFNTPEGCPYGAACRFRHAPADGKDVGQQATSSAGKPKPCMKYFSTSGCPFGESCHFLHHVPGGISSLGLTPKATHSAASASPLQKKSAGLAGDANVTVNGYKTKLCNRFSTAEGCQFGDQCHFAHGENDLRQPNSIPRGNNRSIANGLTGTPPRFSNGGSHFRNPPGYTAPPGNPQNFPTQGYGQPNKPAVSANNPGYPNPATYSAPRGNVSGFPHQSYPEPNQHGVPVDAGSVSYPSQTMSDNVPLY